MDDYFPYIGKQKGLNFSNNINNHHRYFSIDNTKHNFYKKYNNHKFNNYRAKQEINNNNYSNNILKIANINKDEMNSIKNNTAITYYNNNNLLNKQLTNNKKDKENNNNIFPETYYNYYQKYKAKKSNDIISKSYNNIKMNNININNIPTNTIKNLNLLLPDFFKIKKNNINNSNINNNNNNKQKGIYGHSYSISNKKNKNKTINNINYNNPFNLKNNNNILGNPDNQKIFLKSKDNLTSIDFLQNTNNLNIFKNDSTNSYSNNKKRGLSTDNKNLNPNKTDNLFNNINQININSSNKKKCPLCNKEIEKYKYKFHYNLHPSKIFNWLYLGCYRNACDRQEIKDLGINYVLNCAIECMESFPKGVKYCHLKLNDMPFFKITPHLERATSFINKAHISNGIILVHCQLGISRSTSCVIAYMIKYMGYTAMNALNFIKKKRPQVMPNFGFLQQLITYEKNHIGSGENNENNNIYNN